jgi:benzoyl-CoA reductase subunit C
MNELFSLARTIRNPHLDEWVKQGGKVVGFSCVATPREIMDAAGILPYRIRALNHPGKDLADAYLSRFNCSYCRACLQLGLDGTYDFFDGLIETNGCDHLRGMFENWQHARKLDFFHYLKVPHLITDEGIEYYAEELELFRQALAEHFGKEISDTDLSEAVKCSNRIRDKLHRVLAQRERARPALTGAEALALFLAETALPPKVFEGQLDDLLAHLPTRQLPKPQARLLLGGAATDEIALVEQMEGFGALVVADTLCYGSRATWKLDLPEAGGDLLPAMAEAYLKHLLCPRMFDDYEMRMDYLLEAVQRAAVDGVVLVYNKFCDLHGVENVRLGRDLEKQGIPVLVLEKEYGAGADEGRISTRVQAFLERIGG